MERDLIRIVRENKNVEVKTYFTDLQDALDALNAFILFFKENDFPKKELFNYMNDIYNNGKPKNNDTQIEN